MSKNRSIFIEITLTNNCNCKCSYCFEGNHNSCQRNLDIENRQLTLLVDACKQFNISKHDKLTISFWGGEPFLNTDFMFKIFEQTYKYDFVQYHCYSNGTLTEKYKQLFALPYFDQLKNKLHIQLSYDGEPHHTIKRGNNREQIFQTAKLLQENNIFFSFKATLAYDLIDKLPEIWDSYYDLTLMFGHDISYFPTLDTSTSPSLESYEDWKKAIVQIAKKEYRYIQEYGHPLWRWFADGRKMNCGLGNSIHMHNDGNIYVCHGCPYLKDPSRFITGNINNIKSLYEVISEKFNMNLDEKCVKCDATHCSACHVTQLKDTDNIYEKWSSCRSNDENKCKYYRWFGYISKLLKLSILKNN